MRLRSRLDVFSAALLSALGASQIVACGGSAFTGDGIGGAPSGGRGGDGAAGLGAAGSGAAGAGVAGSDAGGTSSGGASSGGTSNGGTSGGGAGGSPNKYPCLHPNDLGNGLTSCDGFTHRDAPSMCMTSVPRPEPVPSMPPSAQCQSDADCTAQPYGWCASDGRPPGFPGPGPFCAYGCVKDSDCDASQVCQCGDPVGQCVHADCTTDTDCEAGFLCKGYDASGGCNATTFTCQSPLDTCGSDADCASLGPNHGCGFDRVTNHFACISTGCVFGRPFLIEGAARWAKAAPRADWNELALLPRLESIDRQLALELSQEWTRMALMEHASIAAFARFSLQLLSLGAPPELLERATSAMADETKHAKACFALASAYAAKPVGPGLLSIDDSLNGTSLEEIVLNTIREGCIGETVAAIEAREAAAHAADPALKQLLSVISEDETKHAELAFRFVQWALTLGDVKLEAAVRREISALEREGQHHFDAPTSAAHARWLEHGVVPELLRQVIRAQAIQSVILPCARALLATSGLAADSALVRVQPQSTCPA
jgi:hypothetical protein